MLNPQPLLPIWRKLKEQSAWKSQQPGKRVKQTSSRLVSGEFLISFISFIRRRRPRFALQPRGRSLRGKGRRADPASWLSAAAGLALGTESEASANEHDCALKLHRRKLNIGKQLQTMQTTNKTQQACACLSSRYPCPARPSVF
ncbi:uncharacterized protein VTP21DRAFT_10721 [Calcarisporiella thermophila]|uniref:uncharacterized protein n=1 Tax=Calcarisporiella thermophila TaxID=911321 RepID=UPI003742AD91